MQWTYGPDLINMHATVGAAASPRCPVFAFRIKNWSSKVNVFPIPFFSIFAWESRHRTPDVITWPVSRALSVIHVVSAA